MGARLSIGYRGGMAPVDRPVDPLERAIGALDPALAAFAREHGLAVVRNDRGRPGRSLRWSSGGVERAIDIGPADEAEPTWDVWAVAWRTEPRREGKTTLVRDALRAEALAAEAPAALEEARATAEGWGAGDLEPWTDPEPVAEEKNRLQILGWILVLLAGALVVWGTDWILEKVLGL